MKSWRRWAGLMAACLLVVLVVTPAVDRIVCLGDAPAASATPAQGQAFDVAVETVSDSHAATQGAGDGDACPHGHCHHGLTFVVDRPNAVMAAMPPRARLGAGITAALASHDPGGLDRPPRI